MYQDIVKLTPIEQRVADVWDPSRHVTPGGLLEGDALARDTGLTAAQAKAVVLRLWSMRRIVGPKTPEQR